jgi:DNA-binding IclR family transcriptional regulator
MGDGRNLNGAVGSRPAASGRARRGTQALERGLALMRAFPPSREATLRELADRTNLPDSTAHRLLRALVEHGFVRHTPGGPYELQMLDLGDLSAEAGMLRDAASASIARLHDRTGHTVHLSVLDAGQVLYLEKIEGRGTIRMVSKPGGRAPAYCTGIGKALLSRLSAKAFEQWLRAVAPLTEYTPQTLTDPDDLRSELEWIRRQGVAFDRGEHERYVRCVAAQIRTDSRVIGAVSLSMVTVDTREVARFAPLLRDVAEQIRQTFAELRA